MEGDARSGRAGRTVARSHCVRARTLHPNMCLWVALSTPCPAPTPLGDHAVGRWVETRPLLPPPPGGGGPVSPPRRALWCY